MWTWTKPLKLLPCRRTTFLGLCCRFLTRHSPILPLVTFPSVSKAIDSTSATVAQALSFAIAREHRRRVVQSTGPLTQSVQKGNGELLDDAMEIDGEFDDEEDGMTLDPPQLNEMDAEEEEDEKPIEVVTTDFFGRKVVKYVSPVKKKKGSLSTGFDMSLFAVNVKKGQFPLYYKYFEGCVQSILHSSHS